MDIFKKLGFLFLTLLSLLFIASNCYATTCASGVVEKIIVGYDDVDSGNGIQIKMPGLAKLIHTNTGRNLNDKPGYAILDILMYSKATATPIDIIDNKGTKCDDFDEVVLK